MVQLNITCMHYDVIVPVAPAGLPPVELISSRCRSVECIYLYVKSK